MDNRLIQNLKNSWRNCNSSTVGFLANIPSDKLKEKPFDPRFKSFAWEFSCLVRTRYCYLEALKTGKLNFADREGIPIKKDLERESKQQLLQRLSDLTNDFIKEIEKINNAEKVDLVNWLYQHERIHHGKLMLCLTQANLKLPKSFTKTWGESSFPKS